MPWSKARQLSFLRKAPVIRVATVSKNGRPQVTPVCHIEWKGKIYWVSDPGAIKLENIGHHRWVALVADEYRASWHKMGGVMAQGKAKLIRRGPLFREVRARLYRKYKAYKSNSPFEEGESIILEVKPENLFSWWYR